MPGRHAELTDPNLDLPELPPVHDTTFGFTALDYGNIALESVRQGSETGTEHMSQLFEELGSVRERLKNLTPHQKGIADDYLKQYFADSPAKDRTSLTEWLSDEKGASDSTLFDFLQRHAEELAFQQHSEETQLMIKQLKTDYMTRVRAAYDDGWLSSNMIEKLSQVEKVEVIIGDMWDTQILDREGYYMPNKHGHILIIGQSMDLTAPHNELKRKLDWAAWHEFVHLETEFDIPSFLRESLAEHINQGLKNGQFEVIDPRLRLGEDGTYGEDRQLTAALLQLGDLYIPSKLAVRGFSSANPQGSEWRQFTAALDESWGKKGMLEHVGRKVSQYTTEIKTQDQMWVTAERTRGHIVEPMSPRQIEAEAAQRMTMELEVYRYKKDQLVK